MSLQEQYAKALFETKAHTRKTTRELMDNFHKALKRRHHERLLPKILGEYRKLEQRHNNAQVRVRISTEKEKDAAVSKAHELVGSGDHMLHITHDHSLVSGYVVEGRDFRYDNSARKKLLNLYKRLTTV